MTWCVVCNSEQSRPEWCSALGLLREDFVSLRSLGIAVDDVSKLRENVQAIQLVAVEHFNSLGVALRVLDDSEFAEGTGWESSTSADWDAFVDSLDRAYSPNRNAPQIQLIASDAAQKLLNLTARTHKLLDAEVSRHIAA